MIAGSTMVGRMLKKEESGRGQDGDHNTCSLTFDGANGSCKYGPPLFVSSGCKI